MLVGEISMKLLFEIIEFISMSHMCKPDTLIYTKPICGCYFGSVLISCVVLCTELI